MARNIGYIRVSSADQNTARQLDGIELDLIYEEKISGATTARPELQALLKAVTTGDVVHVHSMDRLARSLYDLHKIVGEINAKGATVKFHKEAKEYNGVFSAQDELFLQVLGAFSQYERSIIRERQAEGIAKAKASGVYAKHGKKPSINDNLVAELKRRVAAGEPKARVAKELGISRDSLYRLLK